MYTTEINVYYIYYLYYYIIYNTKPDMILISIRMVYVIICIFYALHFTCKLVNLLNKNNCNRSFGFWYYLLNKNYYF